jgi:hypothetical protein
MPAFESLDEVAPVVYVRDEGSVFEEPIDTVWRYLLEGGEQHTAAHQESSRFLNAKVISPNCAELTAERRIDGRWSRFVSRTTHYAPLAVANEELEGDLAGSKFVLVFTPQRRRTRVDMFGDFHSETIPANRLERVVLGWFEGSFNEDVPALKSFSGR